MPGRLPSTAAPTASPLPARAIAQDDFGWPPRQGPGASNTGTPSLFPENPGNFRGKNNMLAINHMPHIIPGMGKIYDDVQRQATKPRPAAAKVAKPKIERPALPVQEASPLSAAVAGRSSKPKGTTVQTLVGIDQGDLDWLEMVRRQMGYRSRTETLRYVLAKARVSK